MDTGTISRRELLQRAGQLGLLALTRRLLPAYAWGAGLIAEARPVREEAVDLAMRQLPVAFGGRRGMAFRSTGRSPAP